MNQLLEIDAAKEGKVGKLIRASSREMASFICVLQQSGSIISGGSLLDLNKREVTYRDLWQHIVLIVSL